MISGIFKIIWIIIKMLLPFLGIAVVGGGIFLVVVAIFSEVDAARYNKEKWIEEDKRKQRISGTPPCKRNCYCSACKYDEELWQDRLKFQDDNGENVVITHCRHSRHDGDEVKISENMECEYFDPIIASIK